MASCTNCLPMLLPRLGVAGQQDAGRAVAQEDGYRVVVGLREELAGRRGDDILKRAARSNRTTLQHHQIVRAMNLGSLPRRALKLFGESQGEDRAPRVEGARGEHLRLR